MFIYLIFNFYSFYFFQATIIPSRISNKLFSTHSSLSINSLNTSFQIVVRIRELELDKYLNGFRKRMNDQDETVYKKQVENYIEFVGKLVTNNKILTRRFYVILPYKSTDTDFSIVQEQLKLSADIVSKGLGRLGMQTQKLNSLEVLDLFYSFYSPSQAKRQPLREQTIQLLKEAYL